MIVYPTDVVANRLEFLEENVEILKTQIEQQGKDHTEQILSLRADYDAKMKSFDERLNISEKKSTSSLNSLKNAVEILHNVLKDF